MHVYSYCAALILQARGARAGRAAGARVRRDPAAGVASRVHLSARAVQSALACVRRAARRAGRSAAQRAAGRDSGARRRAQIPEHSGGRCAARGHRAVLEPGFCMLLCSPFLVYVSSDLQLPRCMYSYDI